MLALLAMPGMAQNPTDARAHEGSDGPALPTEITRVVWNPEIVRAQGQLGTIVYPFTTPPTFLAVHDDSAELKTPELIGEDGIPFTDPEFLAFPWAVFRGHTEGIEGADVMISITPAGIAGFVDLADVRMIMEPSKIYLGEGERADTVLIEVPRLPVEVPQEMSVGVMSTPVSRPFKTQGDFSMYTNVPSSSSHLANTVAWIQTMWGNSFSWSLNQWGNSICIVPTCDATYGMDGTFSNMDALLSKFAGKHYTLHSTQSWQLAAGFTGRTFSCTFGIAELPGHYTMNSARNQCTYYQYASSSYELATNAAHELGHNFGGTHRSADTWSIARYKTVCDLQVPGLGCLQSHEEFDYYEKHYYLLHPDPIHHPPQHYAEPEFSNASETEINDCAGGNWGTLAYTYNPAWIC